METNTDENINKLITKIKSAIRINDTYRENFYKNCKDINPFSASPPHRTYARSARLILRKLLVLRKIVLLTTNMKKDS